MKRAIAKPLAVWHAEHVNFARLLDLLDTQVAALHRGDRQNHDLIGNIVYYLRSFADRFHHPREDVAFARLVERDPDMQSVIDRLLQEHRVIATAGDEFFNRLNEVAGDAMTPRATIEAAAATYLVYYRHHIATEEREIMPRAAQLLTQRDWDAVEANVPPDPLFGDVVEARFQELRSQIAGNVGVLRQEQVSPRKP
jgi:hemerythrin-like domain-containing protein